jgi:hypothetical protein
MAVAYVQEFVVADHSTKNYDSVNEQLANEPLPAELIIHTAGFDDEAGVFRIFDVWESEEAARRFHDERLMPILGPLLAADPTATPPERDSFYPLHNVLRS